jgi:hypothetical protein
MTDELKPILSPAARTISKVVLVIVVSVIALVVLAGVVFVIGLEGY